MSRTLTAKAHRIRAVATVRTAAIVEIAAAVEGEGAVVVDEAAVAVDVTAVVDVMAADTAEAVAGIRIFRHGYSRIHTDLRKVRAL